MTKEPWAADPKAPIDCFYVYPTVSTDATPTSDMSQDPAEKNVVLQQFARFASKCRAVRADVPADHAPRPADALATNAIRWRCSARASVRRRPRCVAALPEERQPGRGVVLIGHSQGAFILQALDRERDRRQAGPETTRRRVHPRRHVPHAEGERRGGQFKQIPLCRKPGQIGCVVNYSAFRSTVPPPANTLFGHSADPASSGNCTNPATLGAGSAPLRAYLSGTGRLIAMGGGQLKPWAADKTVDTPFVTVREC
jgi:hypothetical protein